MAMAARRFSPLPRDLGRLPAHHPTVARQTDLTMPRKLARRPIHGAAFDTRTMEDEEIVRAYIAELDHYKPHGFIGIARDGVAIARAIEQGNCNIGAHLAGWRAQVDDMLTEWTRKVRAARLHVVWLVRSLDRGWLLDRRPGFDR